MKRLEKLHKSCANLWDSIKKKHNEKMEQTFNNKKKVDKMKKAKMKELVVNQNRSQRAIEENQKKIEHSIMLKQELRKLKEMDILTVQERNKRLDMMRKSEVLEKQKRSSDVIKNNKEAHEIMKRRMVEEDVRDLIHKNDVANIFMGITHGKISPIKENKLGIIVSKDMFDDEGEHSD